MNFDNLTDEQVEWLEKKIEEAYYEGVDDYRYYCGGEFSESLAKNDTCNLIAARFMQPAGAKGVNEMTELTKLEVGKTYVFKDERSKYKYIQSHSKNLEVINEVYEDGYLLQQVLDGEGIIEDWVVISSCERHLFKEKEMNKNIRPEDEVTITTTYGDLACVYAVLGRVQGGNLDIYKQLAVVFDDIRGDKRWAVMRGVNSENTLKYAHYRDEFEKALFPQPHVETEQQKQIRELREQAEELLAKAKQLEGGV